MSRFCNQVVVTRICLQMCAQSNTCDYNYMLRERLGGRSAIEVMTGQAPRTAVEMVLWLGKKLKDATVIKTTLEA